MKNKNFSTDELLKEAAKIVEKGGDKDSLKKALDDLMVTLLGDEGFKNLETFATPLLMFTHNIKLLIEKRVLKGVEEKKTTEEIKKIVLDDLEILCNDIFKCIKLIK